MATYQDRRDYGVERWASNRFGWQRVDESHCDLLTERGRPIEAKGCVRWQSNGSDKRTRGRFRLWRRDHEHLADAWGAYLFAVYDDHESWDEPLAWRVLPADRVTPFVPEFYDYSYRPSKGETVLLSWPHVFAAEELDG